MAKLNIDFSKVTASTGKMPVLPTGWQRCIVEESEQVPTANHATTGNELIKVKLKVIDGPYANSVIFKTFNIVNNNAQAQDIGWGEMKALNDALNIAQPEDTNEWHNKPLLAHIKYKPARTIEATATTPQKDYDEGNEVNGFRNINDTSVEVNHNVKGTSGGQPVTMAASFATGGSPVPVVSGPGAMMAAAAAAAKLAAPAPAPKPAPAAPAPKPEPVFELQMTEKATGMSQADFVATDPAWTQELLISEGYAVLVEVKPATPAAPAAPAAPTAPATPAAPAAGGAAPPPPWAKK